MDLIIALLTFTFEEKRHVFAESRSWSKYSKNDEVFVNFGFCKDHICLNMGSRRYIHQKQMLLQKFWDHSVLGIVINQSFPLHTSKYFGKSTMVEFDHLSQIFHNRCEIHIMSVSQSL